MELKVDDVLEVLNTSKKYVVPTLTKICTEFIVQSLDNENACFFLNHGIFFDEKQLQLQVLSYIEQNADAVFEQNDFYNLTHEALLSIVKSDQLSISEMGLIIHVLKWAENHCILQKKPVTKENKRAVLKDVWNFLNFDALTDENFVKIIKKFDVFTHEEIANMFIGRHDPVACSSGTPRAMKRGLKSVELGQEEKYSGAQLPPKETEVNIFCNKDIVIHGLRIHGAMGGAKMVVKAIDHDEHDQAMHEVSWTGTTDKDSLYYSCDFEEPLVVKGHKIKVKICRQQNMLDYQRSWLRMKMNNETNFCGVTFICVENVSLLRSIKYERLYDNILSVWYVRMIILLFYSTDIGKQF